MVQQLKEKIEISDDANTDITLSLVEANQVPTPTNFANVKSQQYMDKSKPTLNTPIAYEESKQGMFHDFFNIH